MKVIEYTGDAHERRIRTEDFVSIGIDDQAEVFIDTRVRHLRSQVVVSDLAAEWLCANDSFRLVENEEDISPFVLRDLRGAIDLPPGADDSFLAAAPARDLDLKGMAAPPVSDEEPNEGEAPPEE